MKNFSLFNKSRSVVGLDIGSSAVKAVELKQAGKGYRVAAYGTEPVPPDSIVDGAIIDGAAVADAIRRLFDGRGIKTKDVAASLSGNAVIVKKITLPQMTEAELAESIYWEAEQYIPFDIQDVNLDYQILDPGTGPESRGSMDVLLVAAKKDKIGDYTGVIAQAGRNPVLVDVDAFALQNAYEANYGLETGRVVVLLNAGASDININIISGEQSLFTRDISMGGNAYTEAVQKELSLPFEAAERAKRGEHVDGAHPEDVRPILRSVTENLLLEVQKTFDFFKATAASERIDRILISGGTSRIDGFTDLLADRFGASRTPVREALRRLQAEGLVELRPGRGLVVSELTIEAILELYVVRIALEGTAAALAARLMTPLELQRLRKTQQELERAVAAPNPTTLATLNTRFHQQICAAEKNRYVSEFTQRIYDALRRSGYKTFTALNHRGQVRDFAKNLVALGRAHELEPATGGRADCFASCPR